MDRELFKTRLSDAGRHAVGFAREFVTQTLPDGVAFLVSPNRSYDGNPRVGDEEVFPDDELPEGQYHGPWTAEEAVVFLWRGGKVPEWIDASVRAEDGTRTLVELRCCGRFTASEELLYHGQREGSIPPFALKSPMLPYDWVNVEQSGRFDLYWDPGVRHPLRR